MAKRSTVPAEDGATFCRRRLVIHTCESRTMNLPEQNSVETFADHQPLIDADGSGDLAAEADDFNEYDSDYYKPPPPLDADPEAISRRCVDGVLAWPIKALGKRPADWLAHDLLMHDHLRDARLWRFHAMWKNPDAWMLDRVAGLPPDLQKRGLQLTALHFLHLRYVDSVREKFLRDWDWDDGAGLRRWKRLWKCRPYGADYEGRSTVHPCGLVWLCPWCWARTGVRVWGRLRAALGDGAELMMLRASITSEHLENAARWFGTGPGLGEPRAGGYKYARPHWIEDGYGNGGRMTDPYSVLNYLQLPASRHQIGLRLDKWAEGLGIRDGMRIYTVEPTMWQEPNTGRYLPQFRFVGRLLGAPPAGPSPDPALRARLDGMGELHEYGPEQKTLVTGSLRGWGGLLVKAMGWPPVSLLPPQQWASYNANMKRRPLYRAFGGWRAILTAPTKPDPFASFSRSKIALKKLNDGKKREACQRRKILLEAARPLWAAAVAAAVTGQKGRPAYKQRLKSLLAEEGVQVTRRQLDELVKDLKG
jgi:hypothetical protein